MNAETTATPGSHQPQRRRGFSGKQVLLFIFLAILLTAGVTYWIIRSYVYASDFSPVELSKKEQLKLDDKLRAVGVDPDALLPQANREASSSANARRQEVVRDAEGNLVPQKYSEAGASRTVDFTERELNAMLANNSDLAKRFAVDLSENLASANLLVPFEPDFPVLGGKTVRVNAGLELDYRDAQPVVILRGVSVMGVPIPNAWLGNLKNIDLVDQFGAGKGFWQSFAQGIETIEIADGKLHIEFQE